MDNDYESVLFVARETYLYQVSHSYSLSLELLKLNTTVSNSKIPPRTSSEGYRAANW